MIFYSADTVGCVVSASSGGCVQIMSGARDMMKQQQDEMFCIYGLLTRVSVNIVPNYIMW